MYYGSVLDVYGPTAHHAWLMEIPGNGSAGPDSSRPIPGGVEYVFGMPTGASNWAVELYAPTYTPVTLRGQNVIDASAKPPTHTYTYLPYERGALTVTTAHCPKG